MTVSAEAAPDVIVVDDDALIGEVLTLHLTQAGFGVRAFSDGRSALLAMLERRPALVILDIDMPRPTGVDVLRRLRAESWGCRLPVMMLTARRRPEQIREAIQAGASDYLVKPIQPELLIARVGRLLGHAAPAAPGPTRHGPQSFVLD